MSLLDAYTELSALQALSITAADEPPPFPRLIASSHACPQDIWEEALDAESDLECPPVVKLPWVVLEFCHGSAVVPSAVNIECAKALGEAVARLQDSAKGELAFLLSRGL